MASDSSSVKECRAEQVDVDKEDLNFHVNCGKNEAILFPAKLKKIRKQISKYIQFQEKWVSPPEFENMSGFHSKKRRQNIRFNGKPVGEWLAKYNSEGVF